MNKTILIPPSKSISHRAVICAILSNSFKKIKNLGDSEDIRATIEGMKNIVNNLNNKIDCKESASTLRFLLPIACAISDKKWIFSGSEGLMKRPMEVYEEIFKKQKLTYVRKENSITIKGKLKPGKYKIRGDISSQFISGLLFALVLLKKDSEIILTTKLQSKEYVNLTIDVIKKYGIKIKKIENGFHIYGNQFYKPTSYFVESDFSSAAFFLVAKEMGAKINLIGLNNKSRQGDKKIIDIIKKTKVKKQGLIVDVSNIPDLVPILAVYMSLCLKTQSKLINGERLRYKESDRLKAITTELNKMGGNIIEGDDYLIINPVKKLHNVKLSSWNDHRIAMALAVAHLNVKGKLKLDNYECVKKSYPNFWNDYKKLIKT